jgi:hypothetical protein
MENYFDRNIEIAQSRFPETQELKNEISEAISIEETRTGSQTLRYNRLLIHSAYDPQKEAATFSQKTQEGNNVFLYGFGLGYHIKAILERIGPKGSLLVIDLNSEIISASFCAIDHTQILKDPRFHLIFNQNQQAAAVEISSQMSRLGISSNENKVDILVHNPSLKCLPQGFEKIANALEILLMERRVPLIFGSLENQNYALNKITISKSDGIISLKETHKGKPGILISAGPSLDNALPYLKSINNLAILACVDTAFPILAKTQIPLDYVFSLDPQDNSFEFFAEHLETSINLVYLATASARIVANSKGQKFVAYKHESFQEEDRALVEEKGTTVAGGSVSCFGLDSLIQMGCNPIFLIGQDCAFTGNRTYARHSIQEDKLMLLVKQERTVASEHLAKSKRIKRTFIPNSQGNEVLSNQLLYSYLRNIEEIAVAHPEIKIYNLWSNGAQIKQTDSVGSYSELFDMLDKLKNG